MSVGLWAVARSHSRVARTLGGRVRLQYASRSLARAEEYRQRFRGVAAFGSYEEACASPEVDAVLICTPPAGHVEHARLAARYRKAMLIEKPLARSLAEVDQIAAAVGANGGLCMVAENYFFKPAVAVLRHHLSQGDIGAVLFVELNRTNRRRVRGWRSEADAMGGGALLEGGVHWINYLLSIGGPAREVLAARPEKPYDLAAPFEDSLAVLVRFADGAVGKLLYSWNLLNHMVGGLQLSRIYGTHGNVTFESNGLFAVVLGRRRRLRVPGLLDIMGYRAMLAHFVDCVSSGRPPAASLAIGRRNIAVVEAAYRSLSTRQFEPVDHS